MPICRADIVPARVLPCAIVPLPCMLNWVGAIANALLEHVTLTLTRQAAAGAPPHAETQKDTFSDTFIFNGTMCVHCHGDNTAAEAGPRRTLE